MVPSPSIPESTDVDLSSERENPFSTIESAQEFVKLLRKVISEAKQELEESVKKESGSEESRRLDAFRIALYSLSKLETHMHQSSRILNDLRMLRRLLLSEREISTTPSANAPGVDKPASAGL